MLHLLPLRILLWAFASIAGVLLGGVLYAGWARDDTAIAVVSAVIRIAGSLTSSAVVAFLVAWRWSQPLQRILFPYLGGRWRGTLCFGPSDNEQARDVTLEVKHNLVRIVMLLESEESTSKTLVVHAARDPDFDRYRLYYLYLNERREGVPGGGDRYRGLAIMRVEPGVPPKLYGDYFTETHRQGRLELTLMVPNPWWMLWR